MTIFAIDKNRFAIGTFGKRAKYVVRARGKSVSGVRGQRPLLDKRYKKATGVPATVKAAFRAALA